MSGNSSAHPLQGSAEFVLSKLTTRGPLCPHNPKLLSSEESGVPSILGFFFSQRPDNILLLGLSGLCSACFTESTHHGYNVYCRLEGKTGSRYSAVNNSNVSRRWWQIETLGLEIYGITADLTRFPLLELSDYHQALVSFSKDQKPFYCTFFHELGKRLPRSVTDRNIAISVRSGKLFRMPPTGRHALSVSDENHAEGISIDENRETTRRSTIRQAILSAVQSPAVRIEQTALRGIETEVQSDNEVAFSHPDISKKASVDGVSKPPGHPAIPGHPDVLKKASVDEVSKPPGHPDTSGHPAISKKGSVDGVSKPPGHPDTSGHPDVSKKGSVDGVSTPPGDPDISKKGLVDGVSMPPAHPDTSKKASVEGVSTPPAHSDTLGHPAIPAHPDTSKKGSVDEVSKPPGHPDSSGHPAIPAYPDISKKGSVDKVSKPPGHPDTSGHPAVPGHPDIYKRKDQ
ncbi:hypothetical protein VTL71DRAFT_6262 [Oculimacula yallundae]|uniref:Uncharacterized protein n=1 Tax=Oculimacula yallundae TaxID=86028 RepID=A0ABR4BZW2_9HELO